MLLLADLSITLTRAAVAMPGWCLELPHLAAFVAVIAGSALASWAVFARRAGTVPLCARCGHALAGLGSLAPSCPECGAPLVDERSLRFGRRRVARTPFAAGIVMVVVALASMPSLAPDALRARRAAAVDALPFDELTAIFVDSIANDRPSAELLIPAVEVAWSRRELGGGALVGDGLGRFRKPGDEPGERTLARFLADPRSIPSSTNCRRRRCAGSRTSSSRWSAPASRTIPISSSSSSAHASRRWRR